ncbi:hypothetical protein K7472_08075 [Streptomyces sp. PTM05]|uniref:Uncharacterized protein n=1 Tax=Streptantibioticus parmotrematis TaxID=2873249 RepID=A0ABS7QNQ6_9ACTN|nr:hypothetical protein [Streptantibioticus parmotrematis]MBY8884802.1 hypothetical protein [Streptantibioticus parmotrematis]
MVRRPYLVGHQEFAALYDVRAQMVQQWLNRGVLDPGTAVVVSGVRYWPLGFACRFGETTPRPKALNAAVKQRLMEAQGEGWLAESPGELPAIVGQQEIVALFHLPAQGNVATTIATGRFPASDWVLSGSGLWLLDTVLGAVDDLRKSARSLAWEADEQVAAALRDGTYDGPGSAVLTRGRYARKAL